MNSTSEFLFRLPAAPASPLLALDPDIGSLGITPASCVTHGLFTTSSWGAVGGLSGFADGGDLGLGPGGKRGVYDTSGTVEEIVHWLQTARPRHWYAAIRAPQTPGGLVSLHQLRQMCAELMLGGIVTAQGRWCLYVRGTVREGYGGCEPVRGGGGVGGGAEGEAPAPTARAEYLCIAVAEATAMLVQLCSEQQW